MKYEIEIIFYNADSGQQDEQIITVESDSEDLQTLAIACGSSPTGEMFNQFFRKMYDNPNEDGTDAGILYEELWTHMSHWAFDKLGWGDVTVDVQGLSINGEKVEINLEAIDIRDWSLQLDRDGGFMYCYA